MSVTVAVAVDAWLDKQEQRWEAGEIRESSLSRYVDAAYKLKHALGPRDLCELTPQEVEAAYRAMKLAGGSVRKVHNALRGAVAWAKREKLCDSVLLDEIELPPQRSAPIRPPASADVARLVSFALGQDQTFGTAVAFIASTGCRRGEALGLHWPDVDLDAQEATIQRSLSVVPGGTKEYPTKTYEPRRVALGTSVVTLLADLQKAPGGGRRRMSSRAATAVRSTRSRSARSSPRRSRRRASNTSGSMRSGTIPRPCCCVRGFPWAS